MNDAQWKSLKRCLYQCDGRKGRIIETLNAVYPKTISAKRLMGRAGYSYHTDPVRSFISLCCELSALKSILLRHGWQVVRSGGTPDDELGLEPIVASQVSAAGRA